MNGLQKYKNYSCKQLAFALCAVYSFISLAAPTAECRSSHKVKTHTVVQPKNTKRKKHPVVKSREQLRKEAAQREAAAREAAIRQEAAREAAAREAQEIRLNEGKNSILDRTYKLYDSGLNESLLGNYKYAILQLTMANELLQEHGQANSSLGVSVLSGIASSAEAAKDYPLARSTYQKILLMRPQDTQILLKLAQSEAASGHFPAAQVAINRIMNIEPNNMEAKMLSDLIDLKIKK